MAETIVSAELDEEVVPSSYTSETESAPAGAGQSPVPYELTQVAQ